MGTMSDLFVAERAGLVGAICSPAVPLSARPAPEQYKNNTPPWFVIALRSTNRPKALVVMKALVGQVAAMAGVDADIKTRLEELAAGTNAQTHKDWYYANKKIGQSIEQTLVGVTARILLEEDLNPTVEENGLPSGLVQVVRVAKEQYESKTAEEVEEELGTWLRSQVTEEEFCNGLT